MDLEVVHFSSGIAKAYLIAQQCDMPIKPKAVARFARLMQEGAWTLAPGAIAFDIHGKLLNGVSRLYAVIRSRRIVPMLVVRNLHSGDRATNQCQPRCFNHSHEAIAVSGICLQVCALLYPDEPVPSTLLLRLVHAAHSDAIGRVIAISADLPSYPFAELRLAVVIRIIQGLDASYVLRMYWLLIRQCPDISVLPAVGRAFLTAMSAAAIDSDRRLRLALAMLVLDPRFECLHELHPDIGTVDALVIEAAQACKQQIMGLAAPQHVLSMFA